MSDVSSFGSAQKVRTPPAERPLMFFDGDCNFCRYWITRWQRSTGSSVDYLEFQKLRDRYPEIAQQSFEGAVQLIELDGLVLSGADAVFRMYDYSAERPRGLALLQRVPGFLPVSRAAYRVIAGHRVFFSKITRWLFRDR